MTHAKTQALKRAYISYLASTYRSLNDCYVNASGEKHTAFDYCLHLENKYNGENLKIISFNTFSFSVGFVGFINDRKAFFYITRDHDRYIYLDEIAKEVAQ